MSTFYLFALVLTIAIELAIVAVARRLVPSIREQPALATCICINLLTHPIAALALPLPILSIELAVIAAEALAYRVVAGISMKWSISLALVANAATMVVGLLVS